MKIIIQKTVQNVFRNTVHKREYKSSDKYMKSKTVNVFMALGVTQAHSARESNN
jgi:hypothetical protein